MSATKIIYNGQVVELPSGGSGSIPSDGESGQVLTKTETGVEWMDPKVGDTLPSGVILIWSGIETNIPNGWQLCDGTNGTPNLKDKFVLGAGSTYKVKSSGGAASVTLTEAQMPSHTHTYKYNSLSENCIRTTSTGTNVFSAAVSSTSSNNTGSKGSGEAHDNMPPYYALCYIMKL